MTTALKSTKDPFQMAILFALTRLENKGKRHVYHGTVSDAEVARRRAANRVARAQRKVNSRSGGTK